MARDTIAVRAASLAELAELLTGLDEFLRSGSAATTALTEHLASRSHAHPGFAACNLIDDVSFTALWLRGLTGHADPARQAGPPAAGHH
jgi:hypothetical protein